MRSGVTFNFDCTFVLSLPDSCTTCCAVKVASTSNKDFSFKLLFHFCFRDPLSNSISVININYICHLLSRSFIRFHGAQDPPMPIFGYSITWIYDSHRQELYPHFNVIWDLFQFASRTKTKRQESLIGQFTKSSEWIKRRDDHGATRKLPYSVKRFQNFCESLMAALSNESNDWTQTYRSQCTFNVFLKKQN